MLNEPFARLYGIPAIEGPEFRKVKLAGQPSRRTADAGERAQGHRQRHDHLAGAAGCMGAQKHPGAARSSPPPNVPAIEPDTHGASTIRAQLAKHREMEACRGLPPKDRPAWFRPRKLRCHGWLEGELLRGLGAGKGVRNWISRSVAGGSVSLGPAGRGRRRDARRPTL